MAEKLKVLVIERDRTAIALLESQFMGRGIKPVFVNTAEEAVDRIESEKFDGVFLDWNLSGTSGDAFTRRIRRSPSNQDVPLICMAPRKRADAIAEASSARIPFYLPKPFEASDVSRVLDLCDGALMEEHCRYIRLPLRVSLSCSWGEGWAAGETVNVSSTGLLIALEVSPRKGNAVTLQMDVPGLDWRLRMEAQVARARSRKEIGVQFVRPSRRGLNPLLRLAHQSEAQPDGRLPGIERRSYQTVQPPGSVGSSPGSDDHPHRPSLPSQPDPVQFLILGEDGRTFSAVTSILGRPGWNVHFARSAEQARLPSRGKQWHLVLADLPEGERAEGVLKTVFEIQRETSAPLLCMIPDGGDPRTRRELANAGIPFLVKPVPATMLLYHVSQHLMSAGVLREPLWHSEAELDSESAEPKVLGESRDRFF